MFIFTPTDFVWLFVLRKQFTYNTYFRDFQLKIEKKKKKQKKLYKFNV